MSPKKDPGYEVFSTGSKWAYRIGGHSQGGFFTADEAAEAAKAELAMNKSGKVEIPPAPPAQ